ncbi:MAG: alpha/beta hydrolase [Asticcacaulis sp.]
MSVDRRQLLSSGLLGAASVLTITGVAQAQTSQTPPSPMETTEYIDLWPNGPSGLINTSLKEITEVTGTPPFGRTWGVTQPRIGVYRPANPNGSAMLVIPGGGYRIASVDKEGRDIARYLAAQGITAFVLIYRMPAEGWEKASDVPLMDAQRAIRLIRRKADDFGIDAEKVGVMGFSAGGHLCASLATRFAANVYAPVDEADALSARPFLSAPIYPVVTMIPGITHKGSHDNLIGADADEATTRLYSTEQHVTADTPPTFIVHSEDDATVPVENALLLRAALKKTGVAVETHLYPYGGHGYGMTNPDLNWGPLFLTFARRQKLFAG